LVCRLLLHAAQTAALLASRGVQLEVIVDEGTGLAIRGIAPFTQQPVALVGTAEKQLQSVQVGIRLLLAAPGLLLTQQHAHAVLLDTAEELGNHCYLSLLVRTLQQAVVVPAPACSAARSTGQAMPNSTSSINIRSDPLRCTKHL
jgi:hypothetical protein